MKGCELFFAGVAILQLLAPQVESRCPSKDGISRDCSFTTCSASDCAAQSLECDPKRCGRSWRVKGMEFSLG
ncbi:secreted salivary gland peptide, putative [Ixodes scapularis]|uniref:Secreted salivary gland peptide, putative n=1 Tax=Ixodes scapularis TaxID=6945 RepID=B7P480_IXOSC|nr:secreted salivary gland peptide, putative [Ixodes scapularis]|eukprot:XP_002405546.1 secreted salivary gland peptide, putative [Ixodes scapularis]